MLSVSATSLTVNSTVFKTGLYDLVKELNPVALLATVVFVLIVSRRCRFSDLPRGLPAFVLRSDS